jgi:hypothetical protein
MEPSLIAAEIGRLKDIRSRAAKHNRSGQNIHEMLDAQIEVLERGMKLDMIHAMYHGQAKFLAERAKLWANDHEPEPPSRMIGPLLIFPETLRGQPTTTNNERIDG